MVKLFIAALVILLFSSIAYTYADSLTKPVKSLIHNEEALNKELKGKDKETVLNVLGEPAVKKPCEECEENLEYWWYNLTKANIFVHFKDGKVIYISVISEDERSKMLQKKEDGIKTVDLEKLNKRFKQDHKKGMIWDI